MWVLGGRESMKWMGVFQDRAQGRVFVAFEPLRNREFQNHLSSSELVRQTYTTVT